MVHPQRAFPDPVATTPKSKLGLPLIVPQSTYHNVCYFVGVQVAFWAELSTPRKMEGKNPQQHKYL